MSRALDFLLELPRVPGLESSKATKKRNCLWWIYGINQYLFYLKHIDETILVRTVGYPRTSSIKHFTTKIKASIMYPSCGQGKDPSLEVDPIKLWPVI
jgi:hypothetical protein